MCNSITHITHNSHDSTVNETISFKMGRGSKEILFQRRHANGHQIHEKCLSLIHRNASQNHNEISVHTGFSMAIIKR